MLFFFPIENPEFLADISFLWLAAIFYVNTQTEKDFTEPQRLLGVACSVVHFCS
jgi:hypothetical protein